MRVAVLGAGYAGLTLARRLEDSLPEDAELVVVEADGTHLLQHELHRLLRRPELEDDIVVELDAILDRATVREATVEGVDREARTVALSDGTLDYDVAAICLGAATDFQDVPGVAEHALPLKRVEHARAIRAAAGEAFADGGRAVVAGAGLSGVQVAGELAELAAEADGAEVCLLEQLDDVAPGFPADFRAAVREELDARDVAVRTGATVERATEGTVGVDGSELSHDLLVWTGGIRGPDALGAERPRVRPTLALDDRTFLAGDAGRVVDAEGSAVPASAQAAVAAARTAATNVGRVVEALLDGRARPRLDQFTFDSRGWVVSVGDGAVAKVGPAVLRGRAARAVKGGVGARYLAAAGAPRGALDLLREEL
jgi:NADH dehydrogenase